MSQPRAQRPWLLTWLALAAPLLMVLALLVLVQRRGVDRVVAVPPLLIGAGLLITNAVAQGRRRMECAWARRIARLPGAHAVAPGFGASDCGCEAHLFWVSRRPELRFLQRSRSPG